MIQPRLESTATQYRLVLAKHLLAPPSSYRVLASAYSPCTCLYEMFTQDFVSYTLYVAKQVAKLRLNNYSLFKNFSSATQEDGNILTQNFLT